MSASKNGLDAVWRKVETTDPDRTKKISGRPYHGDSVDPIYQIERATELWGPMGETWGIEIEQEQWQPLGVQVTHILTCRLWFPGSTKGLVCIGCTTALTKNGHVDEDTAKKTLTDALTKGLSWLGFSADIYSGRFDDNKYVQTLREEKKQEQRQKAAPDWAKDWPPAQRGVPVEVCAKIGAMKRMPTVIDDKGGRQLWATARKNEWTASLMKDVLATIDEELDSSKKITSGPFFSAILELFSRYKPAEDGTAFGGAA